MVITRKYFNFFWVIFPVFSAIVTAVVIGFANSGGVSVINYYCVQGNSFFGFDPRLFFDCPIYITLIYIILITVGIMLFLLIAAVILDLLMFPIRKIKNKSRVVDNPWK